MTLSSEPTSARGGLVGLLFGEEPAVGGYDAPQPRYAPQPYHAPQAHYPSQHYYAPQPRYAPQSYYAPQPYYGPEPRYPQARYPRTRYTTQVAPEYLPARMPIRIHVDTSKRAVGPPGPTAETATERKSVLTKPIDPTKHPEWYLEDLTLRRGDIVVLKGQVVVHEGANVPATLASFVPLAKSQLVSPGEKDRLKKMADTSGPRERHFFPKRVDATSSRIDGTSLNP